MAKAPEPNTYPWVMDRLQKGEYLGAVYLTDQKITDEQAMALAGALSNNTTVTGVFLERNPIGDDAVEALASAFATMPQLVEVGLSETKMGIKGYNALRDALTGLHPSLGFVWMNDGFMGNDLPLKQHCVQNLNHGRALYRKMRNEVEECSPQEWFEMHERLPLFERHGEVYEGEVSDSPDDPNYAIDCFTTFLKKLPTVEYAPGFSCDQLFEKQGAYAPIDNPLVRAALPELVAQMNADGSHIRAAELITKDGNPSPLFEAFLNSGNAINGLFTTENWKGASKAELNHVLAALPETDAAKISNRHALAASLKTTQGHKR